MPRVTLITSNVISLSQLAYPLHVFLPCCHFVFASQAIKSVSISVSMAVFTARKAAFVPTACLSARSYRNTFVGNTAAVCTGRVTSFTGWKLPSMKRITNPSTTQRKKTTMIVDPWSVSSETLDLVAAQLFAASLFPYLAFLYYLSKKESDCPPVANFGFRFLLAFVGATIPAGIYAKVAYNDILANIDWLHGSAESLLTLTNFIIVIGFRMAISNLIASQPAVSSDDTSTTQADTKPPSPTSSQSPATAMGLALAWFAMVSAAHVEPGNALSFPTWIIHISSLFEWLAAMGLVWQYANVTGNQRWKGLVWGMLPLHTSGLCACTFHLFYNAPTLNALVALQAGLTCFGNATMALATYRIANSDSVVNSAETDESAKLSSDHESNVSYFTKVFVASAIVSAFIKWGSLNVDWPFDPTWPAALALIGIPTTLNILKWAVRSQTSRQQSSVLL